VETKLCRTCGQVKSVADFQRRGEKWQPRCRACQKIAARRWYVGRTPEQEEAKRTRERGWYDRLTPEQQEARRQYDRSRMRHLDPSFIDYQRQWNKDHPGPAQARGNRRRARRRGAVGFHTSDEWKALQAAHGGLCAYCRLRPGVTKDHIVPLSRGGSDWIENIAPACRSCNARKRDLSVRDFVNEIQRRQSPEWRGLER
jgi:5-methylcytosine-specific restriction endonuclease McrA